MKKPIKVTGNYFGKWVAYIRSNVITLYSIDENEILQQDSQIIFVKEDIENIVNAWEKAQSEAPSIPLLNSDIIDDANEILHPSMNFDPGSNIPNEHRDKLE